MAKCKKCKVNEIWNKRLCLICLNKWLDIRISAWKNVVIKIGEPTCDNQKEFNKQLKKEEKDLSNLTNHPNG